LKDRLGSFFFEEHDDPVFVEDEFPEDPYWASIVSGLMQVTIGVLAIYTVKGFIGSCRPAVANLNGPPIQILNGNPVNVVPRPNGMQLIAAAAGAGFGGRGLGDQAVNLAGQLLRSTLQRTNFLERIAKRATDLAKKGLDINMHALEEVFDDFKKTYVSETAAQRQNMYLTNENLLLMQSPSGNDAFAVVENFSTGASETVPIFRPSNDAWEQMHTELASRMNITPVHRSIFRLLPENEVESDSDAPVFKPNAEKAREAERRAMQAKHTKKLEEIRSVMDVMYNSMMTLPIDKRDALRTQLLDLDEQHKQLHGEGYLHIVREAFEMDHPGEGKDDEDVFNWDDIPVGNFRKGDIVSYVGTNDAIGLVVDYSPIDNMVVVKAFDNTLKRIDESRLRKVTVRKVKKENDDAPDMPQDR
jgi:hypothetical protein